jgi:hypothetical protein
MARKTALLFALGVLGCCGALNGSALAQAQPMPPMRELPPPPAQARQMQSERGLPFEDVIALVRSMDLDPVTAPIRRGARYVVRAVDQYGNMVRVVVDGQLARVVALRPVMGRARSIEYAPPTDYPPRVVYGPSPYGPQAEARAPARWGDNYVPEYGEVPPPRADVPSRADVPTLRPDPGPQARLAPASRPAPTTGPSVIYADPTRSREAALPPERIHAPLSHAPLAHTPLLPRAGEGGHALTVTKPPPLPRSRPAEEQAALQPDVTHPDAAPAASTAPVAPPASQASAAVVPPQSAPAAQDAPTKHDAPTKQDVPTNAGESDFPPVQPPF